MSIDVDRPETGASDVSNASTVSEKQAREVAEAARETEWTRPSFAKELYLGRFDVSLIHPYPTSSEEDSAHDEEFLGRLRAYCESLDGRVIERESLVPDEYLAGFADQAERLPRVSRETVPARYGFIPHPAP